MSTQRKFIKLAFNREAGLFFCMHNSLESKMWQHDANTQKVWKVKIIQIGIINNRKTANIILETFDGSETMFDVYWANFTSILLPTLEKYWYTEQFYSGQQSIHDYIIEQGSQWIFCWKEQKPHSSTWWINEFNTDKADSQPPSPISVSFPMGMSALEFIMSRKSQ